MDETTKSWKQWQADLSLRKEASEKKASAMHAEDPTEKGRVEAKPCGDEAHRSNINLPSNPTRNTVQTKDGIHGLCATGPYSVGEGEYPTAIDGDARDAAYRTPATPLDKIAGNLARSAEQFTIPANIGADADIMRKMAYIGQLAMADERGQALVDDIITKQAGRAEAQAILTEAYNTLQKEAAANNTINNMYNPLIKAAADDFDSQAVSDEGMKARGMYNPMLKTDAITAGLTGANFNDALNSFLAAHASNNGADTTDKMRAATAQIPLNSYSDAAIAATLGADPEEPVFTGGNGSPLTLAGATELEQIAHKLKQQDARAQLHESETFDGGMLPGAENLTVGSPSTLAGLGSAGPNNAKKDNGSKLSMWEQLLKWIQENPGLAAGIGAGTLGLGGGGLALHHYLKNKDKKKKEKQASFHKAAAACAQSHAAWLDTFGTQFEKKAYQQGAMDGEMMANAAEDPAVQQAMGGDAIPADDTQVSDEEVMAAIQALFESGQVSEEQVAAFLQQIQGDQMPAYTAADLAMMLQQDVESGQLDPAAADQIANEITNLVQSGQMPAGGAPQPDPAAMQQGMEVQASVNRTAALYNSML